MAETSGAAFTGLGAGLTGASKEIRQTKEAQQAEQFKAQQELDHMMLQHQLDLEVEKQARLWEIEKMRIRSQIDFDIQEKHRARQLEETENAIARLQEEIDSGRTNMDDRWTQNRMFELRNRKDEILTGGKLNVPKPETQSIPFELQGATPEQVEAYKAAKRQRVENIANPEDIQKHGLSPYWTKYFTEEELADLIREEKLNPKPNTGTEEWWLDPRVVGTPRAQIAAEVHRGYPLTPEEINAIRTQANITENISSTLNSVPEPTSVEEFLDTVATIKDTDPKAAERYYNKFVNKFNK